VEEETARDDANNLLSSDSTSHDIFEITTYRNPVET
jgi:hypothetical protein